MNPAFELDQIHRYIVHLLREAKASARGFGMPDNFVIPPIVIKLLSHELSQYRHGLALGLELNGRFVRSRSFAIDLQNDGFVPLFAIPRSRQIAYGERISLHE